MFSEEEGAGRLRWAVDVSVGCQELFLLTLSCILEHLRVDSGSGVTTDYIQRDQAVGLLCLLCFSTVSVHWHAFCVAGDSVPFLHLD